MVPVLFILGVGSWQSSPESEAAEQMVFSDVAHCLVRLVCSA